MADYFTRWDDDFRRTALARLAERAPNPRCPMCGQTSFTLADGFVNHPVRTDLLGGFLSGGPLIPSILVICTTCGFESFHAAGALARPIREAGGDAVRTTWAGPICVRVLGRIAFRGREDHLNRRSAATAATKLRSGHGSPFAIVCGVSDGGAAGALSREPQRS